MKPGAKAWCLSVAISAALWGGQAFAVDKAKEVETAMSAAEASLAEATRLDSVWAVWDSGIPADEDAPSLDEILEVAKEKQKSGDLDEAMRLAKMVDYYAQEGIVQARGNAAAGIPEFK